MLFSPEEAAGWTKSPCLGVAWYSPRRVQWACMPWAQGLFSAEPWEAPSQSHQGCGRQGGPTTPTSLPSAALDHSVVGPHWLLL